MVKYNNLCKGFQLRLKAKGTKNPLTYTCTAGDMGFLNFRIITYYTLL